MTDLSKGYATALFTLASEKNAVAEYTAALGILKGVMADNPGYVEVLRSPAIPKLERLALVDEAFSAGMPDDVISFLKLLCEHGHIGELDAIVADFDELVRLAENRTIATVYYVEELSDEQKEQLVKKLSKICEKTVDAVYIEDKSLIGGIKVRLEDKLFDGSILGRLKKASGVMSE